jgi:DNA polymerase-3 subunit delta'
LAAGEVEAALESRWGVERQKAKLLARLCHGGLGWAVSAASDSSLLDLRAERIEKLLNIINSDYEGRFAYAAQLAAQFSQNRGTVQEVLDLWLDWWRDLLLVKVGCGDNATNIDHLATLANLAKGYSLAQIKAVIKRIQAAGIQLRQNANPRLVLEVLMLDIPVGRVPLPNLR